LGRVWYPGFPEGDNPEEEMHVKGQKAPKKKTSASRRKSESPATDICRECGAECCRDLTMLITKPRTKEEIDELNWHLRIDTVRVFVRKYKWHLLFKGKCMYLGPDSLCTIYDRRPQRCRRHDPSECERNGAFYDTLISTPEELTRYLNGSGRKKR
jgi:Fe-S-cluster containining protein